MSTIDPRQLPGAGDAFLGNQSSSDQAKIQLGWKNITIKTVPEVGAAARRATPKRRSFWMVSAAPCCQANS